MYRSGLIYQELLKKKKACVRIEFSRDGGDQRVVRAWQTMGTRVPLCGGNLSLLLQALRAPSLAGVW